MRIYTEFEVNNMNIKKKSGISTYYVKVEIRQLLPLQSCFDKYQRAVKVMNVVTKPAIIYPSTGLDIVTNYTV